MRFLTAEEVKLLAEEIGSWDTLVYVLAYGGLRWGAAAALRASDCDLERSRIVVARSLAEVGGQLLVGTTKNHRQREVVVPDFVSASLRYRMEEAAGEPEGLVFTAAGRTYGDKVVGAGRPLRHSNFRRRIWIPATKRAGLSGLRMHDLRHTATALMISAGAHPKTIQAQLGHSSITVTMDRYGHLFPSDRDDLAAELDRRHRQIRIGDVDRLWTQAGPSTAGLEA